MVHSISMTTTFGRTTHGQWTQYATHNRPHNFLYLCTTRRPTDTTNKRPHNVSYPRRPVNGTQQQTTAQLLYLLHSVNGYDKQTTTGRHLRRGTVPPGEGGSGAQVWPDLHRQGPHHRRLLHRHYRAQGMCDASRSPKPPLLLPSCCRSLVLCCSVCSVVGCCTAVVLGSCTNCCVVLCRVVFCCDVMVCFQLQVCCRVYAPLLLCCCSAAIFSVFACVVRGFLFFLCTQGTTTTERPFDSSQHVLPETYADGSGVVCDVF